MHTVVDDGVRVGLVVVVIVMVVVEEVEGVGVLGVWRGRSSSVDGVVNEGQGRCCPVCTPSEDGKRVGVIKAIARFG